MMQLQHRCAFGSKLVSSAAMLGMQELSSAGPGLGSVLPFSPLVSVTLSRRQSMMLFMAGTSAPPHGGTVNGGGVVPSARRASAAGVESSVFGRNEYGKCP